jgi:hypothetical protein
MSRTVAEAAEDLTNMERKPVTPKQVRELIRIGVLPAHKTEYYVPGPRPGGLSPWIIEDSDFTALESKLVGDYMDFDSVAEYPSLAALVKAYKAMVKANAGTDPAK